MSAGRILVLGYIIRMPLGGLVWHYLQFVLGLQRLGYEVYYLEDSCFFEDDKEQWYFDPESGSMGSDSAPGLRFAGTLFHRYGLDDRWAHYDARQSCWVGPAAARIPELCATASLLINVSAANPLREPLRRVPVRVFLDTDPLFSQVRILANPVRRGLALQHNRFFTLGENIGTDRSSVPASGMDWLPTRQPIVLDAWTPSPAPADAPFTTLMAWDSFRSEEYDGVRYGMKSESFRNFLTLPRKVDQPLELALFDPSAPPRDLQDAGWLLSSGYNSTRDPWQYQAYIRNSRAEFSIAKHGYVVSRCGWFSDRSATYLASGRPVLVQETGFSAVLPTGRGLIGFESLDEAVAGVEEINRRYELHCRSARVLAEEYFDSAKVLTSLVERAQASVVVPMTVGGSA